MAPVPVPVFREFKHPELAKVKLANEQVTRKDLELMIKNTNWLIGKGLHVPGYRLTHGGSEDSKKALGWVEKMELSPDGQAVGYSEFTVKGKELIRNKEVRWVSSGIRRDFRITGEPDGPVLPGLYLDHVAVLGAENPAVKGLVDLSRVELAEGASIRPGSEQFVVNEETGEVCYFAEMNFRKEKEMEDKDKSNSELLAMFKEQKKEIDDLKAAHADEKKAREKAEADLKTAQASNTEAKFAEYQGEIETEVKEAQTVLGAGAEFAEKLQAVGAAVFGTKNGEKAFKDLLSVIKKSKLAPKKRLTEGREEEMTEDETVSTSLFAEDGSDLTTQALTEAAYKPNIGKEVNTILSARRKKNPKFTLTDLRNEVREREARR